MYMFFWFFKQLFYILKRFTKHKLLLLFVFFIIAIFLFLKPSFAYSYSDYELEEPPILDDFKSRASQYWDNDNYYISINYTSVGSRFICRIYQKSSLTNSSDFKGYFSSTSRWYVNQNFKCIAYEYNQDGTFYRINPSSFTSYNASNYNTTTILNGHFYWYSNFDMYSDTNYSDLVYAGSVIEPFIENTDNSIIGWNFDNLIINGGSVINSDYSCYLRYTYPNNNTSYEFNIDNYKTISNDIVIFNIPRSRINEDIIIRSGSNIYFSLIAREQLEGGQSILVYDLSGYTLDLTLQEQEEINEDSNKQLLSDIKQEQQQTTEAVENLEDTITNSNIDNSSIYLPTDNTQDITQDGINNIFTSIYNAFCTGEAQDIIFPIPFTNKNITLQANYVRQMLTNSGANWVITIIEAFWWYLISRFIISDVSRKITKIKSGNVENIENNNIKEEML